MALPFSVGKYRPLLYASFQPKNFIALLFPPRYIVRMEAYLGMFTVSFFSVRTNQSSASPSARAQNTKIVGSRREIGIGISMCILSGSGFKKSGPPHHQKNAVLPKFHQSVSKCAQIFELGVIPCQLAKCFCRWC